MTLISIVMMAIGGLMYMYMLSVYILQEYISNLQCETVDAKSHLETLSDCAVHTKSTLPNLMHPSILYNLLTSPRSRPRYERLHLVAQHLVVDLHGRHCLPCHGTERNGRCLGLQ